MANARSDPVGLSFSKRHLFHFSVHLHMELDLPSENIEGLILSFMVLEREAVTPLEMENLAGIPLGFGKDQLMPPWFCHSSQRDLLGDRD